MEGAEIARQLRQIADALAPPPAAMPDVIGDDAALAGFLLRANHRIRHHLDRALFADPARDILLDLFVSHASGRQVSVTACCAAAGVPHTTGLRWVQLLRTNGYVSLRDDPRDRRRSWAELTSDGLSAMRAYLGEVRSSLEAAEASDAPLPNGGAQDRYGAPPPTRLPRHPDA